MDAEQQRGDGSPVKPADQEEISNKEEEENQPDIIEFADNVKFNDALLATTLPENKGCIKEWDQIGMCLVFFEPNYSLPSILLLLDRKKDEVLALCITRCIVRVVQFSTSLLEETITTRPPSLLNLKNKKRFQPAAKHTAAVMKVPRFFPVKHDELEYFLDKNNHKQYPHAVAASKTFTGDQSFQDWLKYATVAHEFEVNSSVLAVRIMSLEEQSNFDTETINDDMSEQFPVLWATIDDVLPCLNGQKIHVLDKSLSTKEEQTQVSKVEHDDSDIEIDDALTEAAARRRAVDIATAKREAAAVELHKARLLVAAADRAAAMSVTEDMAESNTTTVQHKNTVNTAVQLAATNAVDFTNPWPEKSDQPSGPASTALTLSNSGSASMPSSISNNTFPGFGAPTRIQQMDMAERELNLKLLQAKLVSVNHVNKLMLDPNQLSDQQISVINAQASMNVSSTTTTTTTSKASTTTSRKQHFFNEKRHHVLGWSNTNVGVFALNDNLLDHLLNADFPTESKRGKIKRFLDGITAANPHFDYVNTQEMVDNLLNFDYWPEKLENHQHAKGLGIAAFFPQQLETLKQQKRERGYQDDADTGTLDWKAMQQRQLKVGKIPTTELETERLLSLLQLFYSRLFGKSCILVSMFEKAKQVAAARNHTLALNQMQQDWYPLVGVHILHAIDKGIRAFFDQELTWEQQSRQRVQLPSLLRSLDFIEMGMPPSTSMLPFLLQPHHQVKRPENTQQTGTGEDTALQTTQRDRDPVTERNPKKPRLSTPKSGKFVCKLDNDHKTALEACWAKSKSLPNNSTDRFNMKYLRHNYEKNSDLCVALGLSKQTCPYTALFGVCSSNDCLTGKSKREHPEVLPSTFNKAAFLNRCNTYSGTQEG